MTEVQNREEFERNHKIELLNFEKLILQLKELDEPAFKPLDNTLLETLETIFGRIPKKGRVKPEDVFQQAMQAIPDLDAQRMIIDNLMEALKRGDNLGKTVDLYHDLGLLSESLGGNTDDEPIPEAGKKLTKRKRFWNQAGLTVLQIALNAFKTIPKWLQVEPIITLAPVPGISFAIKGKGMSVYDMVKNLTKDISISED